MRSQGSTIAAKLTALAIVAMLTATLVGCDDVVHPPPPPVDDSPPAGVSDLEARFTADGIRLSWTAPGDDGNVGSASAYDIRYASSSLNNTTWDNAVSVTNTTFAPKPAGSAEVLIVDGVTPNTAHHFALMSVDESGNWSPLSNVATIDVPLPRNVDIRTTWFNAPGQVNIDISWTLPSGAVVPVNRSGWGQTGQESHTNQPDNIPDGLHWLEFFLDGNGRTADIDYSIVFLNYRFSFADQATGKLRRIIALDVKNGSAHPVFNGWLSADRPTSGSAAGWHTAEILAAWRGNQNVNIDIALTRPSGAPAPVVKRGWGNQGFESITIPAGVDLTEGNYEIDLFLDGNGATSDVTLIVDFPGYQFRVSGDVTGKARHTIGLDVDSGVAREIFNGWDEAVATTGSRPLQVVAGWWVPGQTHTLNLDLSLLDPGNARIAGWRNGWHTEGYEHIHFPAGLEIAEGTYRVDMLLDGNGPGRVIYDLDVFGASFEIDQLMQAKVQRTIGVDVHDSKGHIVYNGFLDTEVVAPNPLLAFDAVAGWYDADTGPMHLDLNVRLPDARNLAIQRAGFNSQGFERAFIQSPSAVLDGEYEIKMFLEGNGRSATVELGLAILGVPFSSGPVQLQGRTTKVVVIDVSGGEPRVVSSDW